MNGSAMGTSQWSRMSKRKSDRGDSGGVDLPINPVQRRVSGGKGIYAARRLPKGGDAPNAVALAFDRERRYVYGHCGAVHTLVDDCKASASATNNHNTNDCHYWYDDRALCAMTYSLHRERSAVGPQRLLIADDSCLDGSRPRCTSASRNALDIDKAHTAVARAVQRESMFLRKRFSKETHKGSLTAFAHRGGGGHQGTHLNSASSTSDATCNNIHTRMDSGHSITPPSVSHASSVGDDWNFFIAGAASAGRACSATNCCPPSSNAQQSPRRTPSLHFRDTISPSRTTSKPCSAEDLVTTSQSILKEWDAARREADRTATSAGHVEFLRRHRRKANNLWT